MFRIRIILGKFVYGIRNMIPDSWYLRILFKRFMHQRLNLISPVTFNEKLQWLKLNDRNPLYSMLVDKIEVKKWVADKIGEEYVIPTYAVWNNPDEIDLSKLPDSFVLKCNHYGGNNGVFIVRDKSKFDLEAAKKILKQTQGRCIYRNLGEWPYKNVSKRILAERFIGENVNDYKFNCYNGFAESVMICTGRGSGDTKFYFFDKSWNLKRYNRRGKDAPKDFTLPKPKGIEKMFDLASTLSKDIPFVRVDMYNIDGEIYFGEMTFYPASGFDGNLLPETDVFFGNMIKIN